MSYVHVMSEKNSVNSLNFVFQGYFYFCVYIHIEGKQWNSSFKFWDLFPG